MTVEVIVPFRGGCPHRERVWRWVRARYEAEGFRMVEAPAPDGAWCKAAAVVPAIEASGAEVVAIIDADVWLPGLEDAVTAVEEGAVWSIPHLKVHRLTESGTAAVLFGEEFERQPLEQRPYGGIIGGGAVVGRRAAIEACPPDTRFTGWGQEDESWGVALWTILGEPWRSKQPLWHLFHPPQVREDRRRGSCESWALRRRYFGARRDPVAMRTLLEEARCPSIA